MPSQTFFNLPEEKRTRFLEAARKEFSRVSFESASINQIVRDAGVSRGSFYMYFDDKEDLFLYLQIDAMEKLRADMVQSLEASGGDLFQLFEDLFDQLSTILESEENRHLMRNASEYVRILRANNQEKRKDPHHGEQFIKMMVDVTALVDTTNLRLENQEELREVFLMLWSILPHDLSPFDDPKLTKEERKQKFLRKLDWFKYGLVKKPETEA